MNPGACHINERLAEMLGYTVKEMEPVSTETWKSLTHPQDFVKAEQQLLRHMNGEIEYFEYETRMRHKAGKNPRSRRRSSHHGRHLR